MQVRHYKLISELASPQTPEVFRITRTSHSKLSRNSSVLSSTMNESAIKITSIIPKAQESRISTGLHRNRSYLDCRKLTSQSKNMQTIEDWEMNPIEEIQMRRTSQKQTIDCKQLCNNNIENRTHFTPKNKFKKNHMHKVTIINHQGKPKVYYFMN